MAAVLAGRAAFHRGRAGDVLAFLNELPASPARETLAATLRVAMQGPDALAEIDTESRGVVEQLASIVTMPAHLERLEYLPVERVSGTTRSRKKAPAARSGGKKAPPTRSGAKKKKASAAKSGKGRGRPRG
jgi:hypothetical protein